MDVRLINPFINATINVLETMAFVGASSGKPYLKKDNVAVGDVSGVLGLKGVADGTICVSFEERCILKIVSNMSGKTIKKLNSDEIVDTVGKLTNMIAGQARRELEKDGKIFKEASPSVIVGKNHTIAGFPDSPKIAIPFNTVHGDFTIEVCF